MGKHLTKADRIKLEALLKAGHGKKEIADMLHVHRSTIYREIKREFIQGLTLISHRKSDTARTLQTISTGRI